MPKTTRRMKSLLGLLWTKVIDPWLEEIADDRRRGETAWAIMLIVIGLVIGVAAIGVIFLVVAGVWTLVFKAPIALVIILAVVAALLGIGWFVWTLAGDGSNDRERSR